jgi:hypothetical protein
VAGAALALETESVRVGLCFFGAGGGAPELTLAEEAGGEMVLTVRGSREGLAVSALETATFCGLLLEVQPLAEAAEPAALAQQMAAAEVTVVAAPEGWQLSAPAGDGSALTLAVPAAPSCFYSVDGAALTANQWAVSLRGE